MKPFFADSFYWLALFNPRDAAHQLALAISRTLEGSVLTTDWVLTEVAVALCSPTNRVACGEFLDDLRRSSRIIIEPASRQLFDAAWTLYRARHDKEWSLTDCVSFIVMQKFSIATALTGDHHFEQAGFQILLK